jgi:hypothetical protein
MREEDEMPEAVAALDALREPESKLQSDPTLLK